MNVSETPLAGLLIIEPKIFTDNRGYFFEAYHQEKYTALNVSPFVQTNVSHSNRNVVRGLHYQLPNAQGKLVGVTYGVIWDVAVDIRRQSPTFGQWFAITLSDENHKQIYIPPGFAHGFSVLSDTADVYYQCTAPYTPANEHGISWKDPRLNITWPVKEPILSAKDAVYPCLNEIADDKLFA